MFENDQAHLTPREKAVLALIGQGARCAEIAKALGIASYTVRKHRSHLAAKLGLHGTAQLVSYAVKLEVRTTELGVSSIARLSKRQLQVLRHIEAGLSSKQIAKKLSISPATVMKHRENISKRLHAKGIAELIAYASIVDRT